MKQLLEAVVGLALLTGMSPAWAGLYQFNISGDAEASFQLQSEPEPNSVRLDVGDWWYDDSFTLSDISVVYNGVSTFATLEFYSEDDWLGGFALNVGNSGAPEISGIGSYLFTGPSSDPVFKLGTFDLSGYFQGAFSGLSYTLTISEVTAAVPEPESWALIMVGLGVVGIARRRRKNQSI